MADARTGLKPLMGMAVIFAITRTFANGAMHDLAGFGPWVGLAVGAAYLRWAAGQEDLRKSDAYAWNPTVAGLAVFVGVVSLGIGPVILFGLLLLVACKNANFGKALKALLLEGVRPEPERAPPSHTKATARPRKESPSAPLAAIFDAPAEPTPEAVAHVEPVTFTTDATVIETVVPQASTIVTSSLADTWQPEPIATSTTDNWGLSTGSSSSGFDEALAMLQGRKPEDPPNA